MLRLAMPPTFQEGVEKLMTHILSFWGEHGRHKSQTPDGLRGRRESGGERPSFRA